MEAEITNELKANDKQTGRIVKVLKQTSNSYLVFLEKTSNKGIDCDQWFEYKEFHERFELITDK